MAEERFTLSKTGYEALKQELAALEADYQEHRANFEDANSDIDPSREEGAYFDTRVTKEHFEERIGHLKLVLERAEVITEDPNPRGVDPGGDRPDGASRVRPGAFRPGDVAGRDQRGRGLLPRGRAGEALG